MSSHLNVIILGIILHYQYPTRELSQGDIPSQNLNGEL